VHLSYLPGVDEHAVDSALESKMANAIKIVELVRAMRMKSNLKTRQPLSRIIIPVVSKEHQKSIVEMEEVILEEINVKRIEFVTDESGITKKKAKPNFKTLGKKYGKDVQGIATTIREFTGDQIQRLQREGTLQIETAGQRYDILPEDVEILHEDIKGWLVESDGALTVALDTELNEALITEGFAREFVNRIQNLRKDSGFEVTDRIRIYHRSSERLAKALEAMSDYVRQETLAKDIRRLQDAEQSILTFNISEINGEKSEIAVEKI
jgi:isoleucyl-tRNA synthetase